MKMSWSVLTTETLGAFNMLKSKLVEPLLLALPQPHILYMIGTDTFAYALAAVFLQQQNDSSLNE